ncbi:hypothetical protein DGMP_33470 [Desulfomarina profundi]|uniref:Spermatogenesis-associated protein 20-like TRX domain-containing protein n=1 Tax=Desulfomarina profundi TaxID=2772557 RepID=A0A8D5FQP3_9BACT|nr:thioredoxin domain-containing protein [Desulfomarina profundi]BCL62654.1 hypothetical protein DGMP_33470 [Desulfomarina profundi]
MIVLSENTATKGRSVVSFLLICCYRALRSGHAGLSEIVKIIVLSLFITVPIHSYGAEKVDMKQSPALKKILREALTVKSNDYKPRTRHFTENGTPIYINRLILEGSPYLLQHAHNPVNWYTWGDEPFEIARKLGLPVLLSIGYSTCHWCHVMEEESFEDEEIAQYLNNNYVAIKVDREEHPDIDSVYMAAVQALTGRGGWPMTVWLTPERRPFYGGTYFPDRDRGRSIGFLTLLKKLSQMYRNQPEKIEKAGLALTKAIQQQLQPVSGNNLPGVEMLQQVMEKYRDYHDPVYGGLKGRPKFPATLPVRLLFRYSRRSGDKQILSIARLTLEKMAAGGIYDQVGGGFHRYSTDEKWLVPHFEKMLYDNALLAVTYLDGYQATGDKTFKRVAEETLNYIRRDMTSPEGAFYSATDADSITPQGHRKEGYYFTWTSSELDEVLGAERAKIIKTYYGVGRKNNFEGRNILHVPETLTQTAKKLNISKEKLLAAIEDSKKTLYDVRNRRPHPLRDEKILTAWNSQMISAYARAGLILGKQQYTDRAVQAAEFILNNLYKPAGLDQVAQLQQANKIQTPAKQPSAVELSDKPPGLDQVAQLQQANKIQTPAKQPSAVELSDKPPGLDQVAQLQQANKIQTPAKQPSAVELSDKPPGLDQVAQLQQANKIQTPAKQPSAVEFSDKPAGLDQVAQLQQTNKIQTPAKQPSAAELSDKPAGLDQVAQLQQTNKIQTPAKQPSAAELSDKPPGLDRMAQLQQTNKILYRNYKDGYSRHTAYLDDYAFFIAALIDLYEATSYIHWLEKAIELDTILQDRYEDQDGGFFMTARGRTDLIAREKPVRDGAEPSGNSIALLNLLRLAEYTTDKSYSIRAEKMLTIFPTGTSANPMVLSEMLMALDFLTDRVKEIIIVTPPGKKETADIFLQILRKTYLPNRILTIVAEGEDAARQAQFIPLVQGKTTLMGKTTAYVCEQGSCHLPTTDPKVFASQISRINRLP